MPKKKPFTERFEVMDCSKMHDGCYRIYALDGLKTVCLYLARPKEVGEFLSEEMVLSGLSEFSLENSNLIGKRLVRFGTFIETLLFTLMPQVTNLLGAGNSNFTQMLMKFQKPIFCLLYTSPSPRDQRGSRMPSSA